MSNDTPTNDDLMKIYADNCPFVRPFLALDIPTPDEPFDEEERQLWHLIGTDLRSAVTKPITLTAGWSVTQAKIAVTFTRTTGSRARIRNFKISYPNWCALRHDGRDGIIRTMLADSGIELITPEAEPASGAA